MVEVPKWVDRGEVVPIRCRNNRITLCHGEYVLHYDEPINVILY